MYVRIENNEIKFRGALPKAYKNVSGFDKLDDVALADHGFYPCDVEVPEVKNLTKKLKDEKMTNKKAQLESMVFKILKDTDFIMLEDNAVDVNALNKLKDMRVNLYGLNGKLATISKANLKELFNLLRKAVNASENRFNIFNNDMEALATFVATL